MLRSAACGSIHLTLQRLAGNSPISFISNFMASSSSSSAASEKSIQDARTIRNGEMDCQAAQGKRKMVGELSLPSAARTESTSDRLQYSHPVNDVHKLHQHVKLNSRSKKARQMKANSSKSSIGRNTQSISMGKPVLNFVPATSLTRSRVPELYLNGNKGKERGEKDTAAHVSDGPDEGVKMLETLLRSEAPYMQRNSSEGRYSTMSSSSGQVNEWRPADAALGPPRIMTEIPSPQLGTAAPSYRGLTPSPARSFTSSTDELPYQPGLSNTEQNLDSGPTADQKSRSDSQPQQTLFEKPVTGFDFLTSLFSRLPISAPEPSALPKPSFTTLIKQDASTSPAYRREMGKLRNPVSPMMWGPSTKPADPPTLGSPSLDNDITILDNAISAAITRASFSVDKNTIVHQLALRLQDGMHKVASPPQKHEEVQAPFSELPDEDIEKATSGEENDSEKEIVAEQNTLRQSAESSASASTSLSTFGQSFLGRSPSIPGPSPFRLSNGTEARDFASRAERSDAGRRSNTPTQPARQKHTLARRRRGNRSRERTSATRKAQTIDNGEFEESQPTTTTTDDDAGSLSDASGTSRLVRAVTHKINSTNRSDVEEPPSGGSDDVQKLRAEFGRAVVELDKVSPNISSVSVSRPYCLRYDTAAPSDQTSPATAAGDNRRLAKAAECPVLLKRVAPRLSISDTPIWVY